MMPLANGSEPVFNRRWNSSYEFADWAADSHCRFSLRDTGVASDEPSNMTTAIWTADR